jgi:hypothetical protein
MEVNFVLSKIAYDSRMANLRRNDPKRYDALDDELRWYAGRFADNFSKRYKVPSTAEDFFFRVLYEQIRWAAYKKQRLQPKKFVELLFDEYANGEHADVESFMLMLQGYKPKSAKSA